jgi:hypothetical protein
MKTILGLAALVALSGCYVHKELQVEMVKAELIKIDTVYRQSNSQKQVLTWRDQYNMEYVTYVPLDEAYVVGTKLTMLRNR